MYLLRLATAESLDSFTFNNSDPLKWIQPATKSNFFEQDRSTPMCSQINICSECRDGIILL